MEHYLPIYDPETDEWYFTSPMGRHSGRSNRQTCQALIVAILPKHIEKANGGGAEGSIFYDYFATLSKSPMPEGVEAEAQTNRPPEPPRCRKPYLRHRWQGDGPEATCGRCSVTRSTFDRARDRVEEWRKRTNLRAIA